MLGACFHDLAQPLLVSLVKRRLGRRLTLCVLDDNPFPEGLRVKGRLARFKMVLSRWHQWHNEAMDFANVRQIKLLLAECYFVVEVFEKVQVHPYIVVVLDRRRQLHLEAVEGYHSQFVDFHNDFMAFDYERKPLNADEHVDGVEDLEGGRVCVREGLLTLVGELAADRVKAVRNEVVIVIDRVFLVCGLICAQTVVFVYVRAEGLLVFGVQLRKVTLQLDELHGRNLDVRKCEKLFDAHSE